MKKRDTRLWKYVKPLLKCEYDLIVRTNVNREIWEHEIADGRVQTIKLNKKTNKIEVVVKCIFEEF